jgi:hypothetical protein
MIDGNSCSRRILLAATGSGFIAGCLGESSEETPTTKTRNTPSPTPIPTETESDESGPLSGTEGGETDVHVGDYGATPDNDTDDTAAVRAAFQAAAQSGATVTFDEGTYQLQSPGPVIKEVDGLPYDQDICSIREMENLTVDGNGATFSMTGRTVDSQRVFAQTFRFERCPGLTVQDLTLQWDRDIPHTGGTVAQVTDGYVDVDVNDPYTPREGLLAISLIQYNTNLERVQGPLVNQAGSEKTCERRSDSRLRVYTVQNLSHIFTRGQGILVRHAQGPGMGMRIRGSPNTTLQNVTQHEIPGFAVRAGGHDLTIEDCTVEPRDGLWQSAARDSFHLTNMSGDIRLRNIRAAKSGDDAFNIKTWRREVTVEGARQLNLKRIVGETWFERGHTIEIGIGPNPWAVEATATIQSLDGPRTNLTLLLEDPLPASVREADVVSVINTDRTPDSVLLEDSEITAVRGITRYSVDHITVRNCHFHDMQGSPMWLQLSPLEGEPLEDFTVENNRFERVTTIRQYIHGYGEESQECPSDFFSDHTYRNNTFTEIRAPNPAISLNHISNIAITGNDFSGVADGVDPVEFGDNVDCDTVTIDGQTGCSFPSG